MAMPLPCCALHSRTVETFQKVSGRPPRMKVNRGRVVAPDCAAARRRPTDAHAQRHATMDDDQDAYEEALHLVGSGVGYRRDLCR